MGNYASPKPTIRRPLAQPNAGALYRARVDLVMRCQTEFFMLFDGGDTLLPGFFDTVDWIMEELDKTGFDIGYARELRNGKPSPYVCHHTVVCRTSAVQSLRFPDGCYHIETLVYPLLRKRGFVRSERIVYDWLQGDKGASLWADTARGIMNSHMHHQGRPGIHISTDYANFPNS